MINDSRTGHNCFGLSSDQKLNSDKTYIWKNESTDYIGVVLENTIIASELNSAKIQLMNVNFDGINETAYDNFSMETRNLLSRYINHQKILNSKEEAKGLVVILESIDVDLDEFKKRSSKRESEIINGRNI
jgi:hypothetical protein